MQVIKSSFKTMSIALVAVCATIGSAEANLINNGSFEAPTVSTDPVEVFTSTSSPGLPGWTVLNTGDVALIEKDLVIGAFTFPAQDGDYWLDLTGNENNGVAKGVTQDVATTIGESYTLSYFVGNIIPGQTSTVDLAINDIAFASSTNSVSTNVLDWRLFTHSFIASSSTTKITFTNGDPVQDISNGLDNVVLVESAVPESGALAVLSVGLMGLGLQIRRRRKRNG